MSNLVCEIFSKFDFILVRYFKETRIVVLHFYFIQDESGIGIDCIEVEMDFVGTFNGTRLFEKKKYCQESVKHFQGNRICSLFIHFARQYRVSVISSFLRRQSLSIRFPRGNRGTIDPMA